MREGNHRPVSPNTRTSGVLPRMFSTAACHGRGVTEAASLRRFFCDLKPPADLKKHLITSFRIFLSANDNDGALKCAAVSVCRRPQSCTPYRSFRHERRSRVPSVDQLRECVWAEKCSASRGEVEETLEIWGMIRANPQSRLLQAVGLRRALSGFL